MRARVKKGQGTDRESGRTGRETVSLEDIVLSTRVSLEVLTALLGEKGVVTREESLEKLAAQRAVFQTLLEKVRSR
jgi:hypothetical protein